MIGYSGGVVRAPLPMPDAEAREEIRRCLKDAENALNFSSTQPPIYA
jgi:hypothetical protein